jgi:hypothetical protein
MWLMVAYSSVGTDSGMIIWRLHRRHLISTPAGTKRAKRLPHLQRSDSAGDCLAPSFFIDPFILSMIAAVFFASFTQDLETAPWV